MNTAPTISLRAMEPEDLDLLYTLENYQELWEVGCTNVPFSRYALTDYLANTTYDIYKDQQVRLIIENEEHRVVGIIDLTSFDPKHQRAELGIVILKDLRQQGYATAAIEAISTYALHTLHLNQLYAIISETNQASLNLFRKAGFTDDTTLRNWLYDGKNYHNAIVAQKFL